MHGVRYRSKRKEESVEVILDAMVLEGWEVLDALDTGAGSVDHLVTGPGGAFAVHARSQPGDASIAHAPEAWMREAAAQASAASAWLGVPVVPLLVLRHASPDRPYAERRGVTIVAACGLAAHLRAAARSGAVPRFARRGSSVAA